MKLQMAGGKMRVAAWVLIVMMIVGLLGVATPGVQAAPAADWPKGGDPLANRVENSAGGITDRANSDQRIADSDQRIADSDLRIANSDQRIADSDLRIADSDQRIADIENEGPQILEVHTPVARQVFQRQDENGGRGAVPVKGVIGGVEPLVGDAALYARAKARAGYSMADRGFTRGTTTEWIKIGVVNASRTDFSGVLPNVDCGWYDVEIKLIAGEDPEGETVSTTSVAQVGVGEVFIVAGQSNACAYGEGKSVALDERVSATSCDPSDPEWVQGSDTLPRVSGSQGAAASFMPHLGDMIAGDAGTPVAFIMCAQGSSTVAMWQKGHGSGLYTRLTDALSITGKNGARAILWHQGETDTDSGTETAAYAERLKNIIQQTRIDGGWDVPWGVAIASYVLVNPVEKMAKITAGQRQVLNEMRDQSVFQGAETDALTGPAWRRPVPDGVHFNQNGLKEHARLWLYALSDFFGERLFDIPVNKVALNALIDEYADDEKDDCAGYTDETWVVFEEAMGKAKEAKADGGIRQIDVNTAHDRLVKAVEARRMKIDKRALQAAWTQYMALNSEDYTSGFEAVAEALEVARRVLEETPLPDEETGKNLALEKTASASSRLNANFDPARAVDGQWPAHANNSNEGWASGVGKPQWWMVDLGEQTRFDRFVVKHDGAARLNMSGNTARAFALQISETGAVDGSWTTVWSITDNPAEATINDEVLDAAWTARYVRLYFTEPIQNVDATPMARIGQFELYNTGAVRQADVDQALSDLLAAVAGLVSNRSHEAEFVLLADLVAKAKSHPAGLYTPESWATLAEAVEAADRILAKPDAYTGEDVFNACKALIEGENGLVYQVNRTLLRSCIEYARDLLKRPELFIPASVANLEEKTVAAEQTADDPDATQAQVDAAAAALIASIAQVYERGDKRSLQSLVKLAEFYVQINYTPASWSVFIDAISAAKEILSNDNALQDRIDQVCDQLTLAIKQLARRANMAGLNASILLGQSIADHPEKYISSTLSGLNEALAQAKIVASNANATQSQVDGATDALNARILSARLKPDAATQQTSPNTGPSQTSLRLSETKTLPLFPEAFGVVLAEEISAAAALIMPEQFATAYRIGQRKSATASGRTGEGNLRFPVQTAERFYLRAYCCFRSVPLLLQAGHPGRVVL